MSLDVQSLLTRQSMLQGRIARAVENLKKVGKASLTAAAVEVRVQTLEQNWETFKVNNDSLMSDHWRAISEHEYITADFYGLVEESFMVQKAQFLDLLHSLRREASEQGSDNGSIAGARSASSRRTLPRIQLPQFSGSYQEWPPFRDLFRSIIDSDGTLSNVERLHYLKTSLKGEAEQLVRNLPTTGDNFVRAWSRLTEYYENKRLLVRSCFSSFSATQKMKAESSVEMKRVFHSMLNTVGTLESIGRPISNCTDLFVHLVVELLDSRSRREWETAISDTTDPPAYDTLRTFLECRMRALEALQPSNATSNSPQSAKGGNSTSRSAQAHHTQRAGKGSGRCAACKGDHYILFCEEFQDTGAEEGSGGDRKVVLQLPGQAHGGRMPVEEDVLGVQTTPSHHDPRRVLQNRRGPRRGRRFTPRSADQG